LQYRFESIYPLSPGTFKVTENEKMGVVDEFGNQLVPLEYEQVGNPMPGYYIVKQNGKTGLIDSLQQAVLPIEYDRVWIEPRAGFRVFGTRSREGRYYYDLDKGTFFPFEKDDLNGFTDDRWVVKQGGSWVLADRDFKIIPNPDAYSIRRVLSADRFLAGSRNRYVILNKNMELIASIPPNFTHVTKRQFGYLEARDQNGGYALMSMDGEVLTEPIYKTFTFPTKDETLYLFETHPRFPEVLLSFERLDGRKGHLTGLGQEVYGE
ncbi:MAG: WG repeat-containing protein, partial [Bacteroidota bacterium]